MSEPLRVLIIEDSALDAKVLVGLLQAGGYEVASERVETAEQYGAALNAAEWGSVVVCLGLLVAQWMERKKGSASEGVPVK